MPTPKDYFLRGLLTPSGIVWQVTGPNGQPIVDVSRFLQVISLRGLSPNTMRTYAHDLLCIYRWMKQNALKPDRVTEEDLLRFIEHLSTLPHASPSLINNRLCMLQRFIAFLGGKPPIIGAWQPLRTSSRRPQGSFGFVGIKLPRRVVRPLTDTEAMGFFDSLHTWRDRAITLLMFYLGLRANEVLQLRLNDLDLRNMTLLVHGKGNKGRVLPLDQVVVDALVRYLQTERPATSSAFLFIVLKGPRRKQAMTYAGLRRIFRYHRRTSGITRANPHRFRHSFATNMVKARMPLLSLAKLMGHSSPQTTMRYVQVHDTELREQYLQALEHLRVARSRHA